MIKDMVLELQDCSSGGGHFLDLIELAAACQLFWEGPKRRSAGDKHHPGNVRRVSSSPLSDGLTKYSGKRNSSPMQQAEDR
jgi:hypothetical protein